MSFKHKEITPLSNNKQATAIFMDSSRPSVQFDSPTEKDNHAKMNTPQTTKPQQCLGKKYRLGWLWSGIIGGGIVILCFLIFAFVKPGFRVTAYYINEDPSMLTGLLSTDLSAIDSITVEKTVQEEVKRRKDLIEDLLDQKVIVSSQEFASNLTGYYNTLVEVLAGILIILNIIGFFSWKSNANSSLEQKRKELDEIIDKIDVKLEDNLEKVFTRNSVVKEKVESIFGNLYDENAHLTEEEWEKLHLLLAKYKKEERLEEINEDENNDGIID